MPEIEITPEQEERLCALQEEIARDVVGKYGHVRPRDAVEYLLDRYENDEEADPGNATGDDADDADGDPDDADNAMLNEMMNLLDTHDDKWGESDGDERYAVELPDGTTEQVRTKDDVKALLFDHYR
jgi:hypothetical protein